MYVFRFRLVSLNAQNHFWSFVRSVGQLKCTSLQLNSITKFFYRIIFHGIIISFLFLPLQFFFLFLSFSMLFFSYQTPKPDGNLWRDTMFFFCVCVLYRWHSCTYVKNCSYCSYLNRIVNSYRSLDRCVVNDCSYYKLNEKKKRITNNLTVACVTVQWNLFLYFFFLFLLILHMHVWLPQMGLPFFLSLLLLLVVSFLLQNMFVALSIFWTWNNDNLLLLLRCLVLLYINLYVFLRSGCTKHSKLFGLTSFIVVGWWRRRRWCLCMLNVTVSKTRRRINRR